MGQVSIRGRAAQKGLSKVSFIAKECSQHLNGVREIKEVQNKIRAIFKENLDLEEYLILSDLNGRAIIHTNRLREGHVYNDQVAIKALKTLEPLAQIYPRDTGEVLIDCASPVIINGRHVYTIRLGINIIKKRLLPRILITSLTPIILGMASYYIFPELQNAFYLWAMIGVVFGLTMGIWLYVDFEKVLKMTLMESKSVASGDLTHVTKPMSNDELGRVVYEFNKVSLGLKAIIVDLQASTRQITSSSQEQVQATQEVSQAAEDISTTIEGVVGGAHEQRKNMLEATRITSQVAETMNQMTENSLVAVRLAEETYQAAEKGNIAVDHAIEQMQNIRQSVDVSMKVINDLEEKSIQISKIINTITGIANQTNLLALNAAIEAARAGEQGRGFAVVAEEVRKLAEESSSSAQEIMTIISATQSKTNDAVQAMSIGAKQVEIGTKVINETGAAIAQIMSAVKQTTNQIHDNSSLANQVRDGISSLARDLEKTKDISEEAAEIIVGVSASIEEQIAMSQEIAASSQALSITAESLHQIIERFKV